MHGYDEVTTTERLAFSWALRPGLSAASATSWQHLTTRIILGRRAVTLENY